MVTRNRTPSGGVHVLTVHAAGWPHGPLDEDGLEYDLEHLPSCTMTEQEGWGGGTVVSWDCDVALYAGEIGMPYALDVPVTRPGTYLVKAWSDRYWTDCGWEYDGGLAVEHARPASHGHCRTCHPEQAPRPHMFGGHEHNRRRKARQRRKRR